MPTARTVKDVVLGEAVSGTAAERYRDMLSIGSVIENRARQLGVTPQQVVARQSEFNAYGKPLPQGVNKYRDLAEQALREIETAGPVHTGTFYATPSKTGNLPKGLSKVAQTTGHVYFSDPQQRPINTAVGTRRYQASPAPIQTAYAPTPNKIGAARAIDVAMAPGLRNVPTPTSRPANVGLVPGSRTASAPLSAPDRSRFGSYMPMQAPRAMLDRFAETRPGIKGGRVAPQSVGITTAPIPTARPMTAPARALAVRSPLSQAQEQNLASRMAPRSSLAMAPTPTAAPRGYVSNSSIMAAASLPAGLRAAPARGSRVASNTTTGVPTPTARPSPSQIAAPDPSRFGPNTPMQATRAQVDRYASTRPATSALTPAQATNLSGRLGTYAPTRTAASLRDTPAPSLGSLLGVSAAAAATPKTGSLPSTPTTNFAGKVGSPRSLEGRLPAGALGGVLEPSLPTRTSVPTPTSAPRTAIPQSRPIAQTRVAAPISRPPVTARPAPIAAAPTRTVAAPTRTVASTPAVTRDPWGGLRQATFSSAPRAPTAVTAAPAPTGLFGGLFGGLRAGPIAGAAIGSLVGGPVGGLIGGFIGNRIAGAPVTGRVPTAGVRTSGLTGRSTGGNGRSAASGMGGGIGGGRSSSGTNGTGRAGGVSRAGGGFGGFGERDSVSGPDGGKVGGSSSSKSSSSGKSGKK